MASTTIHPVRAKVLLATPDEPLAACLDRMALAQVGSILVATGGKLAGILTERDLLRQWRKMADPAVLAAPIAKVMTTSVVSLTLDHLADAAELMLERHIRHVPIVDHDQQVIGIVSMRDILAAQQRAGALPRLRPEPAPPVAPGPPSTMHVVAPTNQLAEICKRFLPSNWTPRIWLSAIGLDDLPALRPDHASHRVGFMLDLDGLGANDWRPLIRRFVQLLTQEEQPVIFLVATPSHFSDQDYQSLQKVADKAHWHVYHRPLPVAALAAALRHIGEPAGSAP